MKPVSRLAVALLLALLAGEALAQFSGGFGRGGAGAGGIGGGRGGLGAPRGGSSGERSQPLPAPGNAELLTLQLQNLREDLRLSLVQESAWIGYEDKVLAIADDVSRERNRAPGGVKVLQRLDRSVDSARNRMTALEEVSLAARKLYDQLTPDQQITADPRLATLVQEAMAGASLLPAPGIRSVAAPGGQRAPRD